MKKLFLFNIIFINLIACGSDFRDRENYTPESVTLTAENHVGGYERKDCLLCHNVYLNVHRRSDNGIDVDALNARIRANGESAYCQTCHGKNGTQ